MGNELICSNTLSCLRDQSMVKRFSGLGLLVVIVKSAKFHFHLKQKQSLRQNLQGVSIKDLQHFFLKSAKSVADSEKFAQAVPERGRAPPKARPIICSQNLPKFDCFLEQRLELLAR